MIGEPQGGDGGPRPRRNPEVLWRLEQGIHEMAWDRARKGEEYEDLAVLTLTFRDSIHQLNLVGAEIWTRVNGVNTVDRIAREVAERFEWDPGEAGEAVLEFLKGIEERGWVILPR